MKSVTVNNADLNIDGETFHWRKSYSLLTWCSVFFFLFMVLKTYGFSHTPKVTSSFLATTASKNLFFTDQKGVGAISLDPSLTPFFFKKIPINHCSEGLLLSVPGIGPSLAQAIIETRNEIVFFKDKDDLLFVPGIGKLRVQHFSHFFSFAR